MSTPHFSRAEGLARSREAADAHAITTALREGRLTRPPSKIRAQAQAIVRRLVRTPSRSAPRARVDRAADVTP